jgi:hypothetical protein
LQVRTISRSSGVAATFLRAQQRHSHPLPGQTGPAQFFIGHRPLHPLFHDLQKSFYRDNFSLPGGNNYAGFASI